MGRALILSGGAPNMTLMAGALCFFEENNIRFDVISTAGAGAAIGLVYVAPKGMTPARALRSIVDLGVHDSIYKWFPVNYKVFEKPGYMADLYRGFLRNETLFPISFHGLKVFNVTRMRMTWGTILPIP